MYSANANYPFGNAAQPFTNAAPQQPGMQPAQQIMYNQQQQFAAGMAPQGGFPAGNPQMMPGAHAGMMQSPGMPAMGANGQSESLVRCARLPVLLCCVVRAGLVWSGRIVGPLEHPHGQMTFPARSTTRPLRQTA